MDNPKLIDIEKAAEISGKHKADGKKIVFTNGCFDVIHAGHVYLLKEAKKLGDTLIMGLNTDESIRRLKGESRPKFNLELRAYTLAGLESVDYIVPFKDDTPMRLIEAINPSVLVKGGDYSFETIVGAELVRDSGGEVVAVPLLPGLSSSRIIGSQE